jgi:hypothetical protein
MLTESDTDNEDDTPQLMDFDTPSPDATSASPSFETFSFEMPQTHIQVIPTSHKLCLGIAVEDADDRKEAFEVAAKEEGEEEDVDARSVLASEEDKDDEEEEELDGELADFLASSSDDGDNDDEQHAINSDSDSDSNVHHPSKSTLIECAQNLHYTSLPTHIRQLYHTRKSALDTVNISTADVHPVKKRAELRLSIRKSINDEFNNLIAATSCSLMHLALLSDSIDAVKSLPLRMRMQHDKCSKSSSKLATRYPELLLAASMGALLQYFL